MDYTYIIAIPPGEHKIAAEYVVPLSGKSNYRTHGYVTSILMLEASHSYSLDIFFYPPEKQTEIYKESNEEGMTKKCIDSQAAQVYNLGQIGVERIAIDVYIICYLEEWRM